jgi:hypothetical protein
MKKIRTALVAVALAAGVLTAPPTQPTKIIGPACPLRVTENDCGNHWIDSPTDGGV